jgi:DNA-binding NtrC family response regulator
MSNILIVDDEHLICDLLSEVLSEDGHTTFTAQTAEAALCIIREHPEIDLLFTDIRIPGGMNGLALAAEAKRLRPMLSVLYATGYANELVGEYNPDAPGEVLQKPFRPGHVRTKVRALIA